MSSIAIIILLGIIPIPIIYLFYRRYFIIKPDLPGHLEHFAYGVLLAGMLFIVGMYLKPMSMTRNPLLQGFIHAAMTEKLGTLLVLTFLIFKVKKDFTIMNAVTAAMFLGLGFAALENILYAITKHSSVILVRFLSAVPMHMLSCGLMGYLLAKAKLNASRWYKFQNITLAITVPIFFHGIYDYLLFAGNHYGSKLPYYIPITLVFLIIIMEYILARSQILPGQEDLRADNVALEDWATMEMESQFERWILRSMGSKNREHVPFFSLHLSKTKLLIILSLVIVALLSIIFKGTVASLPAHLTRVETTMLFILLPGFYAFNLLVIGIINPEYFRNSIIKIPIIIDTVCKLEVDDPLKEDDVVDTVTYHISIVNSFMKTPYPLKPGSSVETILYCSAFSSPVIKGKVAYDRHEENAPFSGSLIRFTSRPMGFWMFLVRYYMYRMVRGILFNLKLPGSKEIRQLFVRPVSVMQQEFSYPQGHTVFEQGETGDDFYLIRKGQVNIMKKLESGEEILLETLTRGDIFGEMAVLGNQTRVATAICNQESVLAVAHADDLEAMITSNPEFTKKLIVLLTQRHHRSDSYLRDTIKEINKMHHKRNRLQYTLLKKVMSSIKDNTAIDSEALAQELHIDTETAKNLLEIIAHSKDESDLEEKLDAALIDKLI